MAKKKGISPILVGILALMVVLFVAADQGWIDFLALGRVTAADFQSGEVKLGIEQVSTVICKAIGQLQIINQETFTDPSFESINVPNIAEPTIHIEPLDACSGFACPQWQVVDIRISDQTYTVHDYVSAGLAESAINLQPNTVITINERCPGWGLCSDVNWKVIIKGRLLQLAISDPDGRNEVPIPNTVYCRADFNLNTADMGQHNDNVVSDELTYTSLSTSLTEDEAYTVHYAYDEKANLWTTTYNNYFVQCVFLQKRLWYFNKVSALDGSIWALPGEVALDKRGEPDFCCGNSDCWGALNYGVDYACDDFTCQIGTVGPDCITDKKCSPDRPFVTDTTGDWFLDGTCINGKCNVVKESIDCNPFGIYYDDAGGRICCNPNADGSYSKGICSEGLKYCEANGPYACCLEGNVGYTVKLPQSGQMCCDPNKDLIGQSMTQEECDRVKGENGGENWLDQFFNKMGELFGGTFFEDIIGIFFIIGIVIVGLFALWVVIKIGKKK